MIRIALAQINPTVGDLLGNRQKIVDYINRATKRQADIVVFPEMAICGYPPEDLLLKDHFVKDNIKVLRSIAQKSRKIIIIVGFVDVDKNKILYNAAAVLERGKIKGVYHKENLPNYGVFDEKRYFEPGHSNKIFASGKIKFAVNICEDLWVDQGPYLRQVRKGIDFMVNISCSPYDVGKLAQRERLIKMRAKKTKTAICYLNLIGGQDELVFDGGSLVFDAQGQMVASGKQFEEDLVLVDLKIQGKNDKKNRKIVKGNIATRYTRLERIYKALVLGTHDYINKNRFQKVIIGLSGGIDSALVAAIAVDAIGKDNVIGMTMPSRYTSKGTYSDAKRLAVNLGIKLLEVPIENIFKTYLKALSKEFKGLRSDAAEENIQARIRGNILMALSNKFGWLVLTTGNKSEVAVGYCTLYGDMSGGFAVIKDVPKTKVYELVRFRNKRGHSVIPQSVIDRAPTAELRRNQKDQDALPRYDVLDSMLEAYVEKHHPLAKVAKKGTKHIAKDIIEQVDFSEYKRRQAPPGIKISLRAFGKDWRLPITNKYKEF